jgi:hypothetical protein
MGLVSGCREHARLEATYGMLRRKQVVSDFRIVDNGAIRAR